MKLDVREFGPVTTTFDLDCISCLIQLWVVLHLCIIHSILSYSNLFIYVIPACEHAIARNFSLKIEISKLWWIGIVWQNCMIFTNVVKSSTCT